MANRKPLVSVAGKTKQLPAGDGLDAGTALNEVAKLSPLPTTTGKQYAVVPGAGGTYAWQEIASANTMRVEPIDAATLAQTSFTVPGGYTPTLIDVFRGGVLLDPSEYTATNGTTVVLATGAEAVGERILVKVYGTMLITNALSTTGTAANSSKLGGQLPAYYATEASVSAISERKLFVTPDQVITPSTKIDVTVTGMTTIEDYEIFLRCVTAQNGFAVGAVTKPQDYEHSGTAAYGVTGTFLGLVFTFLIGPLATFSNVTTPGGVAITPANWRVFARIKGA